MKEQISKVTSNPIGSIAGGAAGYYVAKKFLKTEKTWMLVASCIVGVIAGATIQQKMKANAGKPTASVVLGGKK